MIKFTDVKKYYKAETHQVDAIEYLVGLYANTPLGKELEIVTVNDFIDLPDEQLERLQRNTSKTTLEKFALIWRNKNLVEPRYFNQRDNSIKPFVTCASSSNAMLIDFYLRAGGKKGLTSDEGVLKRVFSGKYGRYGSNPSVSWDIQRNVAKSYGVKWKYQWDSNEKALREDLKKGVVTINIYHKGWNRSTRSGGHVVVAVDYDPKRGYLIFDPYGTRPPSYKNKMNGIYWMGQTEFNYRWQGNRTIFQGLV